MNIGINIFDYFFFKVYTFFPITLFSHIQTGHAVGEAMRKRDGESEDFIFLDDSGDGELVEQEPELCADDECADCEEDDTTNPVSLFIPKSAGAESNVAELYMDFKTHQRDV